MRGSDSPWVRQFINGEADGPVHYNFPPPPRWRPTWVCKEAGMLDFLTSPLRRLGHLTVNAVWRLGFASRFLAAILLNSGQSLLRLQMTIREIYFAGVMSLIIIVVSGLFVGMVLACRATPRWPSSAPPTRWRDGGAGAAARAGPGAGRAAVRQPRRQRDDRGNRPDEDHRAAGRDERDGGQSMARVIAPRFWAGVVSMPILAALFNVVGIFGGYLVAW
ncbi:Probable phospholipid ABC transporter permease protein mlaE [Chromobacterium violaceum]|uniref:Probable phospholipid ABC transporter permease protein mlaE n=1 Tax=Chromobacterium violaceum TaxID=536 RepID=A0A3S4HME8_CHRVL|nr:Probable phospholipid ABC transporter permease protein mlaE [Chromobacterium violaceum]